jgi:hypothetical protein
VFLTKAIQGLLAERALASGVFLSSPDSSPGRVVFFSARRIARRSESQRVLLARKLAVASRWRDATDLDFEITIPMFGKLFYRFYDAS